ncbi:hypothetical protein PL026_19595 [Pseudomonas extremaustralis]|nr:hypothetical protein [Pseudomonas extremaustralis]MDB1111317.1 hypothetical protein [Pseudomonas extremaustralis]
MAIPLTLVMTVNACFSLGALFVPDLWSVIEYLFPLALLTLTAITWSALLIYGRYFSRMLVSGGYYSEEHNHLSALHAVFTFAMLSVGFAARAVMSHVKLVSTLAATLSILFLVLPPLVGVIVLVTGISAKMSHGLQPQAPPPQYLDAGTNPDPAGHRTTAPATVPQPSLFRRGEQRNLLRHPHRDLHAATRRPAARLLGYATQRLSAQSH